MHEAAIAEEIRDIVLEKMKENNCKKIDKVKISAGELTSIVPEALEFAYEAVTKDTPMEGSEIETKIVKLAAKCGKCSREFRVKDFNYICPECGNVAVKIIRGREMVIQTIEME